MTMEDEVMKRVPAEWLDLKTIADQFPYGAGKIGSVLIDLERRGLIETRSCGNPQRIEIRKPKPR